MSKYNYYKLKNQKFEVKVKKIKYSAKIYATAFLNGEVIWEDEYWYWKTFEDCKKHTLRNLKKQTREVINKANKNKHKYIKNLLSHDYHQSRILKYLKKEVNNG